METISRQVIVETEAGQARVLIDEIKVDDLFIVLGQRVYCCQEVIDLGQYRYLRSYCGELFKAWTCKKVSVVEPKNCTSLIKSPLDEIFEKEAGFGSRP